MSRIDVPSNIGAVHVGRLLEGTVVVHVYGEQDQSNSPELCGALALAADGDPDTLVVDLASATFVSAALIGAVVLASDAQQRRGARLRVRSPSCVARRVLHLCGLDALVEAPVAPRPLANLHRVMVSA